MSLLLRESRFLLRGGRGDVRDTRRISVAIATFNREAELLPALPALHTDGRVAEIVILDDASDERVYRRLEARVAPFSNKLRLHRNARNLGAFANKVRVVGLCRQEWVVLLDSDNCISRRYLDRLYALPVWSPRVIYCPERAKPQFDYRRLSGCTIDLEAVRLLLAQEPPVLMNAVLGTGNYFVHARSYCTLLEPRGCCAVAAGDVSYANYLWLKSGGLLHVLPGLEYEHRVHKGSLYLNSTEQSRIVILGINDALLSGKEFHPAPLAGADDDGVSRGR